MAAVSAVDQLSSSSFSSTSNVCVFCYESLLDGQQAVGVAVPCGHCFHQACWSAYVASKQRGDPHGRHRMDTNPPTMKCPTCQGKVQTLGKLFLDFECITSTDEVPGDEDLISLSSTEGSGNEEEEDTNDDENVAQNNEAIEEKSARRQQSEIIVLDDAEDDGAVALQQSSQSLQKIRKYKKMTYKWKTKSEQTLAALQKINQENVSLSQNVKELNHSLASCKREIRQELDNSENICSENVDLRFQIAQQRERSKRLETSLAHRDSQLDRTRSDLKKARVDTEKARTNYVVEATELLKEHPVLAAKVKDLEKQNRILQAQLQRTQLGGKATTKNSSMAKADQRKLLRHVSDLRERQDVQQRNNVQMQQGPPRKKVAATPKSLSAGMDVLEKQPVLTTGLLNLGKKRNPATSDRTRYAAYAGAPQKKRLKSTCFR